MERTCFNTELSEKDVGKNVTLVGWVSKRRDLGSIMFLVYLGQAKTMLRK